ncbi:hypothetical protein ABZ208_36865 [Streptomyces sp. NPDC006208]|uniref:hypothetical protein n=1 Tax=Streptomyces sp. NPDC006208 TaxID=3156734 RepID=UPI00339DCD4D
MLARPLPGIYDPTGPGKLLFAFFAAIAETERENIRESVVDTGGSRIQLSPVLLGNLVRW